MRTERGSALWAPALATGKTHASFLPDIAFGRAMTVDWCRGTAELCGRDETTRTLGGAREDIPGSGEPIDAIGP